MGKLAAAFSDKTKLILLNNPQNPAGKMYSRRELEGIAALTQEYDCFALCDEVYEHLVYDGDHIPLMTLPGMRDRCIKVRAAHRCGCRRACLHANRRVGAHNSMKAYVCMCVCAANLRGRRCSCPYVS